MGLSCGNPNALAALQPGEVVLDLGAGGGFDVFIAGRRLGPRGRAMGVDMTPRCWPKPARTQNPTETTGLDNVDVPAGRNRTSAGGRQQCDAVHFQLCRDQSFAGQGAGVAGKNRAGAQAGRACAVSDLALRKPLPTAVAESGRHWWAAWPGRYWCRKRSGWPKRPGLWGTSSRVEVGVHRRHGGLAEPLYQKITKELPAGTKPSDYGDEPSKSRLGSRLKPRQLLWLATEGNRQRREPQWRGPFTRVVGSPSGGLVRMRGGAGQSNRSN